MSEKCAKCGADLPPSPIPPTGDEICCKCAGCEHPIELNGEIEK
jgi:hypothetical protein